MSLVETGSAAPPITHRDLLSFWLPPALIILMKREGSLEAPLINAIARQQGNSVGDFQVPASGRRSMVC